MVINRLTNLKSLDLTYTSSIFAPLIWYQSIPTFIQNLFPSLTWSKKGNENTVYLTFDDGPHPQITTWVMDCLEQNGLKGTFFCVGDNARRFPETLQSIKSRGHVLGNHTMHHIKGWNHTDEDYLADVDKCAEFVDSKLFRPPYGRIKPSQVKSLKNGYQIVMWSLLSCDFDKNLDQASAIDGLKKRTKNGSIVVFHDSEKAEKNLKHLLPQYIEFLNQEGYLCKTL